MLLIGRLEIASIGAIANERLVATAQTLAQAAQYGLAHFCVALGLREVAAHDVAALAHPYVLGLQLGIAALTRDQQRHKRFGIVEDGSVSISCSRSSSRMSLPHSGFRRAAARCFSKTLRSVRARNEQNTWPRMASSIW